MLQEKKKDEATWEIEGKYNLVQWFMAVSAEMNHNVDLSDCSVNFEKLEIRDISDDDKIYIGRIFKLRSVNVPSKIKDGEESHPIPLEDDEYIGEDVLFLYDRGNGILMLQQNRHSIGTLRLMEWINKSCDDTHRVVLGPLIDKFVPNKLNGKCVRSFDISFGNLDMEMDDGPLHDILHGVKRYGGYNAKVSLSVGRTKNAQLDHQNVLDLVNDIRVNSAFISSAKVKVKPMVDDDKGRTETVDLFDNLLHDIIELEVELKMPVDFNKAKTAIFDRYLERREEIVSCMNNR